MKFPLRIMIYSAARLLVLFVVMLFQFRASAQEMIELKSMRSNPGKLRLFVHEPDSLSALPVPLVVVLHGCNQDAHGIMRLSGWNKLANENGFIVAYLEQRGTNNINRCFNWFQKKNTQPNKGELASIMYGIEHVTQLYAIDTSQISITGVSAGAAMAVTAAALYPNWFATVASYAGAPYGINNLIAGAGSMFGWVDRKPWEWARRVRLANNGYRNSYPKMIILQGTNDRVVNPQNAHELMEQWTGLHELNRDSVYVQHSFNANKRVTRSSWSDNHADKVVLYEFDGLGHVLAIDEGTGKHQGGKSGLFSKNIGFHSTYWMAVEMGLVNP